jgi:hypothetical protein
VCGLQKKTAEGFGGWFGSSERLLTFRPLDRRGGVR